MKTIFKIIFWLLVILIIFAILPQGFLDKIKPYFDVEKFFSTLKTGWHNFIGFLEEISGIDFSALPDKIKDTLGIDIIKLWSAIKNFLANIFERLANIFR